MLLISFLRNKLGKINRQNPLCIDNFVEKIEIKNDTYNNVKNGTQIISYYNYDVENKLSLKIARISFRSHNGQIGYFWIDPKYRNRQLVKNILLKSIKIMKRQNPDLKIVWLASVNNRHEFWSNVWNKKFKFKNFVHKSINNSGYIMEIE